MTLEPPSFNGGDHSRSTEDFVQSVTFGIGGPGGAEKDYHTIDIRLYYPFKNSDTFIFLKNHLNYLPIGSLAVVGSDGMLGGPTPAALIA